MCNTSPIRVLIVDDHAVVRGGLKAFLLSYDDIELIGEASEGKEAVQLCAQYQPDVVLMDLVMPGMDGAEATRSIRAKYPQVEVVVLTSFSEEDLVEQALQAGAISYLLKNVSADDLVSAIRAAHARKPTLALEAARSLAHSATHPVSRNYCLTKRERDVLPLLVDGLNNNQIADRLNLSRSTIRFHVSNILAKLDVRSRTSAAAVAVKNNLIS